MSALDSEELTDARLHFILDKMFPSPIDGLRCGSAYWVLGLIGVVGKDSPRYTNGFHMELWPESRLYKRWFDFPDLGKKGWAIILRVWDADSNPRYPGGIYDQFPGWVPPEREKEADHWIAFLNQEIRARLIESGQTPKAPDPAHGPIPPPAPPGPIPVPPLISSAPPSKLFPAGLARQHQPQPAPEPPSPLPPATARRRP